MKTVNQTPFKFAPFVGRLNFPKHSLTLIVKGTFDLTAGAKAVPAQEQPFPTGDEFYPDDEDMQRGPRYESDFAFYKPRADLLLVGKCYPPGGKPAQMCQVTVRVGEKTKTLTVVGNRRWERQGLRYKSTEAEPFTEMELRYENSYGGEKFKKNPVGKGHGLVKDNRGNSNRLLPNIENPANLIESSHSHPELAGFGPLGRMWQTRHEKMGTYKGLYLKTRWPWFPEDFDWTHFNAAPEDMQIEGYLRGNEQLCFENLHPEHPRYESQLPCLRVRCFLNKLTAADSQETQFVEVSMNLDTLWVDMEAEKMVLLWRGWAEVLSEDYEEIQDIFIMSEPVEQPPASFEQCYQQFLDTQAEEKEAETVEPEEPPATLEVPGEAPAGQEKPPIDPAEIEGQMNALLAQMGIDVEKLPPETKTKHARLIKKLTETDPDKAMAMEQQELESQMREMLAKLDLDPDNLPPLSTKAKTEQVRFIKELGLKETDVIADPEFERYWAMTAALLPKMGMNPENLSPLIDQTKKQQEQLKKQLGIEEEEEQEEVAVGAVKKPPPPLTPEAVQERAAKGQSLEGADLRGLDLSGRDLKGVDFSGANLSGANLQNAILKEANLTGANLTGADLSAADMTTANLSGADLTGTKLQRACLKEADLTGAKLAKANLTGAVLDEAIFEQANLSNAVLVEASAVSTYFPEADLTDASFKKGICSKADFSKATLNQTDFQGANLKDASLEGATGRGINLAEADLTHLRASEGCDFTGGVFYNALGPDSIWEKANLTESDFRYARMPGATFTAACLKQADLSAANMKSCRFNKANLTRAKLVLMNLFEGSLEKADLTEADLSGSNMYGAEFLDAVIQNTIARDTNLKRTKLQQK